MPDTPFRTPDEWRRAREAFIEVVIHGWDERLSVVDMWAAKFPPINEGNSGNNDEKGGNNFHVSCPPEPDRAEDERVLAEVVKLSLDVDRLRRFDVSTLERKITNWTPNLQYAAIARAEEALATARTAVLARMQPLGEVYEVVDTHNALGIRVRVIKVPPQEFASGQRVRVVRVAE